MATESTSVDLAAIVTLFGAAVAAVPLFKRAGLGSILGCLAAGLVIGACGIGLFADPMSILQVAELGVVMVFFIIGLEMQPSKLWSMRRDILAWGWRRSWSAWRCSALSGWRWVIPLPHR